MLFFIDIDNKKRYKIQNSINDLHLKDMLRDYKMTGDGILLSIKGIGILEVDDVILDYPQRSAIIKSTMVFDLNAGEDEFDGTGI